MQVLKVIQQHNFQLPYKLGDEIGYGADGQVFNIANDPYKVIKLCILYERDNFDLSKELYIRERVLSYLIDNPSRVYANVYDYVKLGDGERPWLGNQKQKYIIYYYVMEKLEELSKDEARVFHSVLSHEDRGVVKNLSPKKLKEILAGLKIGLDFPEENIIFFIEELKRSKVRHLDLHQRNVMKTSFGEFKMIDFDRAMLKT